MPPTPSKPEILILAAGASSRMRGTDKLLEPVQGHPLIAHAARIALASGCPVSVTLDAAQPGRAAALAGLPVRQIPVPNPAAGMTASLQAGLAALPPTAAVMVLLADMPDVTLQDLTRMLSLHASDPGLILRGADARGAPGHPVLFPAWLRPEVMALQGDPGPREVIRLHKDRLQLVPLGSGATTDLDTPEDWAAWRARQGPK